jgi:hypothetical protein
LGNRPDETVGPRFGGLRAKIFVHHSAAMVAPVRKSFFIKFGSDDQGSEALRHLDGIVAVLVSIAKSAVKDEDHPFAAIIFWFVREELDWFFTHGHRYYGFPHGDGCWAEEEDRSKNHGSSGSVYGQTGEPPIESSRPVRS